MRISKKIKIFHNSLNTADFENLSKFRDYLSFTLKIVFVCEFRRKLKSFIIQYFFFLENKRIFKSLEFYIKNSFFFIKIKKKETLHNMSAHKTLFVYKPKNRIKNYFTEYPPVKDNIGNKYETEVRMTTNSSNKKVKIKLDNQIGRDLSPFLFTQF